MATRQNDSRSRGKKYQNKTTFRNNMHDTSKRTKGINDLEITEVCHQCRDIISWRIKFKKYKFLTQPKTCLRCHQKTVKFNYHALCSPCGKELAVCCKCRQPKDVVLPAPTAKARQTVLLELETEIKLLPERRRRTFHRFLDSLDGKKKKKKSKCPDDDLDECNASEEKAEEKERPPGIEDLATYVEIVRQKLMELGKGISNAEDEEESGEEDSGPESDEGHSD